MHRYHQPLFDLNLNWFQTTEISKLIRLSEAKYDYLPPRQIRVSQLREGISKVGDVWVSHRRRTPIHIHYPQSKCLSSLTV